MLWEPLSAGNAWLAEVVRRGCKSENKTVDISQTAFVTGATGFVGLNLVEQLTARGWKVTVLHRPSSELKYLRRFEVSLVESDLLDRETLAEVMPEDAAVVFHVAGNTSLWSGNDAQQTRDNVEGTRHMVETALQAGVKRFVYTSTFDVYGLAKEAITEETSKDGFSSWVNYTRSKALAEREIQKGVERGLEAVILNPPHIIGRYDRDGWARLIKMVHERRLPGIPPGHGVFGHAEEVARTHISAATKGRTGENYLLGGVHVSFFDVIQMIGNLTGREVPGYCLPAWMLKALAYAQVLTASFTGEEPEVTPELISIVTAHPRIVSDKAERELGYQPTSLRKMLEESYRFLVQEGLIE